MLHRTANHDDTECRSHNGSDGIGSNNGNVERNRNIEHSSNVDLPCEVNTATLNTSTSSEPTYAQVLHAIVSSVPVMDKSNTNGMGFTILPEPTDNHGRKAMSTSFSVVVDSGVGPTMLSVTHHLVLSGNC